MEGEPLNLNIQRPVFKQSEFNNTYKSNEVSDKPSVCSRIKPIFKSYDPRKILNIFSILNVIATYNFKENLVSDILSGLTVGVMQIPQALAYGGLTSLSPVTGLYTSFVPSLTYIIFGTSRHLSVGTFALVSLMIYGSVTRLEAEFMEDKTLVEAINSSITVQDKIKYVTADHIMEFRVKIAGVLCFLCGIIQVIFAIFKFGFITKYLSQPMLRGFNTAAAFHVLSTQMKHVFGIYIKPKPHRLFKIVYTYLVIFENITSINWIAFGISIVAVALMVFTKLYILVKFKKQLRGMPIPVELFVLIVGITISYLLNLNTTQGLAIVGYIPDGLPQPTLPEFNYITAVITDAIVISIVAIASSISISDLYARKHQYKINSNKEIFALGMANISGSFFQCFTSAGALARTAVVDSSGGKSQLVTVISSSIVLIVLLVLSPLLQPLPKACLGSIIIAALTGLLKQCSDIKYYWKLDKISFATWMITFLSTLLLDIDIGLSCGFLAVLFLNTYRTQSMDVVELGQVKDFEIFTDTKTFDTKEFANLKIIRPSQSLLYVNCDDFQKKLNILCPLKTSTRSNNLVQNFMETYTCNKTKNEDDAAEETKSTVRTIILDFSLVVTIDEAGVKALVKVVNEYKSENISILFASVNDEVFKFFARMKCNWNELIYLSVKDAVSASEQDDKHLLDSVQII